MTGIDNGSNNDLEHLHQEGTKALWTNIAFFVVLFIGILLVPILGFGFSAVAIALAFIGSLLYIYLT